MSASATAEGGTHRVRERRLGNEAAARPQPPPRAKRDSRPVTRQQRRRTLRLRAPGGDGGGGEAVDEFCTARSLLRGYRGVLCFIRRAQLFVRVGVALVMFGACGACVASAPAAASPSLRVFASRRSVVVTQNDLRFGSVDLGLWAAAVDGDFHIDIRRPSYGAWTAGQVDSVTGARLRAIPARLIDPFRGLRDFLGVRFVDGRGHVRLAARSRFARMVTRRGWMTRARSIRFI
jgi:hypothetical protein